MRFREDVGMLIRSIGHSWLSCRNLSVVNIVSGKALTGLANLS